MKKLSYYPAVLVLLILVSSCTPYLYAPNTLNMPLARNAHEGKIKAYVSTSDYGLQGSYVVDSHWVATCDGSFYKFTNRTGSNSRTLSDIGGGYFHTIGQNGCFEMLGGLGNGNSIGHSAYQGLYIQDPEQISSLSGNYQRLFVQSDLGFTNGLFELGLGFRASQLFLNHVYYSDTYINQQTQQIKGTVQFVFNNPALLFEPCIHVGFGYHNVKFFFAYGTSALQYDYTISESYKNLFVVSCLSFGVCYNPGRSWGY